MYRDNLLLFAKVILLALRQITTITSKTTTTTRTTTTKKKGKEVDINYPEGLNICSIVDFKTFST